MPPESGHPMLLLLQIYFFTMALLFSMHKVEPKHLLRDLPIPIEPVPWSVFKPGTRRPRCVPSFLKLFLWRCLCVCPHPKAIYN